MLLMRKDRRRKTIKIELFYKLLWEKKINDFHSCIQIDIFMSTCVNIRQTF
jgi:hypothetical protein